MDLGILLPGGERDIPLIRTIAGALPALAAARWSRHFHSGDAAPSVLFSDGLGTREAAVARKLKLTLARFERTPEGLTVLPEGATAGSLWTHPRTLDASTLAEVATPVKVRTPKIPAEAIFRQGPEGGRLLDELARMNLEYEVSFQGNKKAPITLARARVPSIYLLDRGRDGHGPIAYVPSASPRVWIEWGWEIPLPNALADALKVRQIALVNREGQTTPVATPTWSAHGAGFEKAMEKDWSAPPPNLMEAPPKEKFSIRVGLVQGPASDPELWVLSEPALARLGDLIEETPSEDVARLRISRIKGAAGAIYLLREEVRPGTARLGVRVAEVLGNRGLSRVPGTDNLYIPVGRAIAPPMRRDGLRATFGLDTMRLVTLLEGEDGPRALYVKAIDEAPLSTWIRYTMGHRRQELEPTDEELTFDWPELNVQSEPQKSDETAPRVRPPSIRRSAQSEPTPEPRPAEPTPKPAEPTPKPRPTAAPESKASAAMRRRVAELAPILGVGGATNVAAWREFGDLKEALGDLDDAAAAYESAIFLGTPDPGDTEALERIRRKALERSGGRTNPRELASSDAKLSTTEANWLGALVIDLRTRPSAYPPAGGKKNWPPKDSDPFFSASERALFDPELPVSRKLVWAATRAVRAGDKLGIVRSREVLLGRVNVMGLRDVFDMPRFARALGVGASADREHAERVTSLETVWRAAEAKATGTLGAYTRLVFAVGFARLDAATRGAELMAPITREIKTFAPANQALFGLYRERFSQGPAQTPLEDWAIQAQAMLDRSPGLATRAQINASKASSAEVSARSHAEWLVSRSPWLRCRLPTEQTQMDPKVNDVIQAAERTPADAPDATARIMASSFYDFEKRHALAMVLRAALGTGNEELVASTIEPILGSRTGISIIGTRIDTLGLCIAAAAAINHNELVRAIMGAIVEILRPMTGAMEMASQQELLKAAQSSVMALRRVGGAKQAREFLDALLKVAQRGVSHGVRLRAVIATGLLLLNEKTDADRLLDECVADSTDQSPSQQMAPIPRFLAAVDTLTELRNWPVSERTARALAFVAALPSFTDTFAPTTRGLYETNKIVLCESIVSMLTDVSVVQSERVRSFLDAEEQVLRRTIFRDASR